MRTKLKCVEINNWKSLHHTQLEFDDINVLIGKNGSGKSNLIHFFNMLNMMMTGSLQLYIGQRGGANSLLYYGAKATMHIDGKLSFNTEKGNQDYSFRLVHGAPDTLIFASEQVSFHDVKGGHIKPFVEQFGSGHKESELSRPGIKKNTVPSFIKGSLSGCRSFQFHDTTDAAFIRRTCQEDNHRSLLNNGGNIAAILLRIRNEFPQAYSLITTNVRNAVPAFKDFVLEPNNGNLRLEWIDTHRGHLFGTHQLSDGSLRIIALHTLLALPPHMAPSVIIIDEPELGLFPLAIDSLAASIKAASAHSQIILATQSNRLVRYLNTPSLICCSWVDGSTEMLRLSPTDEYFFYGRLYAW